MLVVTATPLFKSEIPLREGVAVVVATPLFKSDRSSSGNGGHGEVGVMVLGVVFVVVVLWTA